MQIYANLSLKETLLLSSTLYCRVHNDLSFSFKKKKKCRMSYFSALNKHMIILSSYFDLFLFFCVIIVDLERFE